ncbi:hypothetical protein PPL_06951 [Heterostelium album PN500]|uniref:HMG box domain-containing protein n=1 Tax=Heterostelium pallidum (strain ATCC 26659 / Pp 5 / PN500) TaxID=670386 RepID=D3BDZ8_HETP5|nr:hypothetical protein PPL_06951 [Heterostelium album PN500]EFA80129.1 hypothetical protein PPL_06951 [Heterostelium album PN500]|eukprot:XP_020432249.1 hypothetical protein PPL_06951 [Heterostelium album PN500]
MDTKILHANNNILISNNNANVIGSNGTKRKSSTPSMPVNMVHYSNGNSINGSGVHIGNGNNSAFGAFTTTQQQQMMTISKGACSKCGGKRKHSKACIYRKKEDDDDLLSPISSSQKDVIQRLDVSALKRYKKHYRLKTKHNSTKDELASAVRLHFDGLPVNEGEIIENFMSAAGSTTATSTNNSSVIDNILSSSNPTNEKEQRRKLREERKQLKLEEKQKKLEEKVDKLLKKRLTPKRPVSSFNLFIKENIVARGGMREAVKFWNHLEADKKSEYERRAREMTKEAEQSNQQVLQPPKRPLSAFQRYAKYMDGKQTAGQWKLLSDLEKKDFLEGAKQDEIEYKQKLDEYETYVGRIKDEIRVSLDSPSHTQ